MREDGVMVSTASTTAENSLSAMVVAVATLENYKKKATPQNVCKSFVASYQTKANHCAFFMTTPAAGAIYKRLGFEDIGFWNMLRYKN